MSKNIDSAPTNTARSRIFQTLTFEYIRKNEYVSKNHFSLFIRGLGGLDSWREKNAYKSCDTATLSNKSTNFNKKNQG